MRKLLPEAWGFLCPVHTPDGSPCGLLNHLAHKCSITTAKYKLDGTRQILAELGVARPDTIVKNVGSGEEQMICVQLDGKVIGHCTAKNGAVIAKKLRHLKLMGEYDLPLDLEIGWVPLSNGGQYPGLYIFGHPSRMSRPVTELVTGKTDYIGPFEQVYLNIACLNEDIVPGITTHQEVTPTNMLSVIANLTPFSDFNQSPRNMYQCQMGKQSMGTPALALSRRTDNKLYKLQCGQTPIVRPKLHDAYGIDSYPNGTNAIVAVLAYTGYDMEDAMILNKNAHERGFGYGTIYKSEEVDLDEFRRRGEPVTCYFGFLDAQDAEKSNLDTDGFPYFF